MRSRVELFEQVRSRSRLEGLRSLRLPDAVLPLGARRVERGEERELLGAVGVRVGVVDDEQHCAVGAGDGELLAVEPELAHLRMIQGQDRTFAWPHVVAGPEGAELLTGQ